MSKTTCPRLAAHLDVGLQEQLLQHMLPSGKAGLSLNRVPSSQDPHSLALRVGAVEPPIPHVACIGVLWIRDLQAQRMLTVRLPLLPWACWYDLVIWYYSC